MKFQREHDEPPELLHHQMPMWRMYRDNTIQTMRERHDNFDFTKVIRNHNQRGNLIQIGSFLGKVKHGKINLNREPRAVSTKDPFLELSTHRNSTKSPQRAVLGSTNEFNLDKTVPESEEDQKQAEAQYLTNILGISHKNIESLEDKQMKTQRTFKNSKSFRPSTRGTISLKRSNLDFIMADKSKAYPQTLTSPTSPTAKPTTASQTVNAVNSNKTFNFESFFTKNTPAQSFVNKLHLTEEGRLISPVMQGIRSSSRVSSGLQTMNYSSIPQIKSPQTSVPPRFRLLTKTQSRPHQINIAKRLKSLTRDQVRPYTSVVPVRKERPTHLQVNTSTAAVMERREIGPRMHYVLVLPAHMHINDLFLRIAYFDINQFREQMLPNKEAIIRNPQLKYLSYEKRLKLVEPPEQLVAQVFKSVLEQINIQLAVTRKLQYNQELEVLRIEKAIPEDQRPPCTIGDIYPEYQHLYRLDGKKVTSLEDISENCRVLLASEEPLEKAPRIQGIEEYIHDVPNMKRNAVEKLIKKKEKQWVRKNPDNEQTVSQFFNPGFQLKQTMPVTEQILCKIILKRYDEALKRQKQYGQRSPSRGKVQEKKFKKIEEAILQLTEKRNSQGRSESPKLSPKRKSFQEDPKQARNLAICSRTTSIRRKKIIEAIAKAESSISRDIMQLQFTKNEIDRRGLFDQTQGLFKLQNKISWDVKTQEIQRTGGSPPRQIPSPGGQLSPGGRKKTSMMASERKQTELLTEEREMDFAELKELCNQFGLNRKDCFKIRSQFFSIVAMHQESQKIMNRRKSSISSRISDDSRRIEGTSEERESGQALQYVPLDFFLENVTLFRFMLPNTIERILSALGKTELQTGIDIMNPKFKVTITNYIELYSVIVLGNLDISSQVAFWYKYFDFQGTGEIQKEEFFDCVEELVRGNVIKERQPATEQYAMMVQTHLDNAGCYDGEVLELEKMKEVCESRKVDIALLSNLLTGQGRQE